MKVLDHVQKCFKIIDVPIIPAAGLSEAPPLPGAFANGDARNPIGGVLFQPLNGPTRHLLFDRALEIAN